MELCWSFYLILIDQWDKEISHSTFIINNETKDLISSGECTWLEKCIRVIGDLQRIYTNLDSPDISKND